MSAVQSEFVQYRFENVQTEYSLVSREVNHTAYFVQGVWLQHYDDLVDHLFIALLVQEGLQLCVRRDFSLDFIDHRIIYDFNEFLVFQFIELF